METLPSLSTKNEERKKERERERKRKRKRRERERRRKKKKETVITQVCKIVLIRSVFVNVVNAM